MYYGLYGYGPYRCGVYNCDIYTHGLYSAGLHCYGLYSPWDITKEHYIWTLSNMHYGLMVEQRYSLYAPLSVR